jgi:gas vesicle protein
MADQTFTSRDPNSMTPSSQGFDKTAGAAKSVADQALSAGRDLKDRAMDAAGASSEAIKDKASDFVDAAKDVASQAGEKLRQTVDGQKNVGAEYVGNLADTMRRAAREFDNDLPIAGTYIRKAASQIEGVSDSIKNGEFEDLIRGAQDFARRQPTAFLGLAVLAGFGLVRFLKSSAPASIGASEMGQGSYTGHGAYVSGDTMRGESRGRQAINEGYRDGFTN